MHPIQFVSFKRDVLTGREAQLVEAILWIAGEMPRQIAIQNGLSLQEAARKGAEIAVGFLAPIFPDLEMRVIDSTGVEPMN